ncbi:MULTISPECIES: hypothetical protein [Asticcacaulis]|jgi:hypothetical protein|uniref:hypothetical protein n=1 Tax=Asticcacaulis TaxID=76890 RepID=UPI001AE8A15F|nr:MULTISPECIES: hypothetical protein [Asticcacaulis]MBP2160542.1 hypothetical protein [Asticcacaulis solisilvae]MDR6801587.1 hypothetical protein [Asticcacaulis sp. BE141]
MDVAKLRHWIKYTRDYEGVNWYLRDVTQTHEYNLIFTLVVYNDQGEVAHKVEFIEPRRGVIPPKFIMRIADAREFAGLNSGFAFSRTRDDKNDARAIFDEQRRRWLESGKQDWINQNSFVKA